MFIIIFSVLFIINIAVVFKYKVYETASSLFIIILLALIDIFRIITVSALFS